VSLGHKLYVVGGFVEGWTPTDEVHEYDPASDRWQRLAALPTPRHALTASVLGGKICSTCARMSGARIWVKERAKRA
jgi:hypothetical protein